MAYEHGHEETGTVMEDEQRGTVERITPHGNKHYLRPGGPERRLSRAVILETTPAYLSQDPDAPDDEEQRNRKLQRRWKYRHLVHQYRRVPQTAVTELLAQLPAVEKNGTEVFGSEITDA
eukprot:1978859-Amphidinium_carterae.1